MPQEKTDLAPMDQKKGLVRNGENEILLEKINCFREETEKQRDERHKKISEDKAKNNIKNHFLELCERKLLITEDQLKRLNEREIAGICRILADKVAAQAHLQTIAGHVVLWVPLFTGTVFALLGSPVLIILSLFSLFSCPIFFGFPSRNYFKGNLTLTKQYGDEHFPVDFLKELWKDK